MVAPMIILCHRRLHLCANLCLSFFLLTSWFEEANCHQSYNLRKLNAVIKHKNREVVAPLVDLPDETLAPVTILRAVFREPQ